MQTRREALKPQVDKFFQRAFAIRKRLEDPRHPLPPLELEPAGGELDAGLQTGLFARTLWAQAEAAERAGDQALALALHQDGIRQTMAALQAHPEQKADLKPTLDRFFQRAFALRSQVGTGAAPAGGDSRVVGSLARLGGGPDALSRGDSAPAGDGGAPAAVGGLQMRKIVQPGVSERGTARRARAKRWRARCLHSRRSSRGTCRSRLAISCSLRPCQTRGETGGVAAYTVGRANPGFSRGTSSSCYAAVLPRLHGSMKSAASSVPGAEVAGGCA